MVISNVNLHYYNALFIIDGMIFLATVSYSWT